MIRAIRTMVTCRWSASRIQRYLDADPAALLTDDEIRRLESHLAVCGRCAAAAAEYRQLDSALSRWAARRMPDPHAVEHMHEVLDRLARGDLP